MRPFVETSRNDDEEDYTVLLSDLYISNALSYEGAADKSFSAYRRGPYLLVNRRALYCQSPSQI